MKSLKFLTAGIFALFLNLVNSNGQATSSYQNYHCFIGNLNFETDSILKTELRNKFTVLKDYKRTKPPRKSKKSSVEYEHYHVRLNLCDSTFIYHKVNQNLLANYKIKIIFETDKDNCEVTYLYCENECGNGINLKMVYNEEFYFISVYYTEFTTGKINRVYMEFPAMY
jgi:hypothetical protein